MAREQLELILIYQASLGSLLRPFARLILHSYPQEWATNFGIR
jgi:hypothetical protein